MRGEEDNEPRSAPLVEMRDGVPYWLVPGSLESGAPVYVRDEALERLWKGEPPTQSTFFDLLLAA